MLIETLHSPILIKDYHILCNFNKSYLSGHFIINFNCNSNIENINNENDKIICKDLPFLSNDFTHISLINTTLNTTLYDIKNDDIMFINENMFIIENINLFSNDSNNSLFSLCFNFSLSIKSFQKILFNLYDKENSKFNMNIQVNLNHCKIQSSNFEKLMNEHSSSYSFSCIDNEFYISIITDNKNIISDSKEENFHSDQLDKQNINTNSNNINNKINSIDNEIINNDNNKIIGDNIQNNQDTSQTYQDNNNDIHVIDVTTEESEENNDVEFGEDYSEEFSEEDDEYSDEDSEEDEDSEDFTYTVDELLQFKDHSECQKEPESLLNSNLPILKKNAQKLQNKRKHNNHNNNKKHRNRRNNRKGKYKNNNNRKASPQVHLREVKPLEKSDNRWVPSVVSSPTNQSHSEEILKQTNSILNKITKENVSKMCSKLIDCLIDDEDVLNGVINNIYDSALEQPKFVQAYAELCSKIHRNNDTPFKKSFMTRLAAKVKDVFLTITTANIGSQANYTIEERNYLIKQRYLGNIEFICNLYKLNLLVNTVPLFCAKELLEQKNDFISEEDSLEALCKMLKSLGGLLQKNSGTQVGIIMKELDRKKDSSPLRIKFMIMDILDLHKNRWLTPGPSIAKRKVVSGNKLKLSHSTDGLPPYSPKRGSSNKPKWKNRNMSQSGVLTFSKPKQANQSLNKWKSPSADIVSSSQKQKNQSKISKDDIQIKEKESTITNEISKTKEIHTSDNNNNIDEFTNKVSNSVKNLIEEYYLIKDLEEAKYCIDELKAPIEYYPIFFSIILRGLKKEQLVLPSCELIEYLLQKNDNITKLHIIEGYKIVFNTIEDDTEEYPNIPKFIGKVFAYCISKNILTLSDSLIINCIKDSFIPIKFYSSILEYLYKDNKNENDIIKDLKLHKLSLEILKNGMNITNDKLPRYIRNEIIMKAVLAVSS